jgi:hypothetical protein
MQAAHKLGDRNWLSCPLGLVRRAPSGFTGTTIHDIEAQSARLFGRAANSRTHPVIEYPEKSGGITIRNRLQYVSGVIHAA